MSATAVAALAMGCEPDVSVATSSTCNRGIGAQSCVVVPPQAVAASRFVVDGTVSAGSLPGATAPTSEYWGAYELPFTSVARETSSTGRVLVTIEDDGVDGNLELLHVFAEQIPVEGNATRLTFYFDLDRFASAPATPGPEDFGVAFDVTGAGRHERLAFAGGAWAPTTPSTTIRAAGGCTPARFEPVRLCNVEIAVALPDPFVPPDPSIDPGIGFALADSTFGGSLPEQIITDDPTPDAANRLLYQTLLFARPTGYPLRFMSLNVRRFEDFWQDFKGDPFTDVSLDELGAFLAPYDIVALQEAWDEDEADRIVNAANAASDPSRRPFRQYGPTQFDPSLIWHFDPWQSSGGLYVLSRFPAINGRYIVYDECRGEDCMKAKGALWVRVALESPVEVEYVADCVQERPGASCGRPPSTDTFIDIFDTHLQATTPEFCEPLILAGVTAALLYLAATSPFTGPIGYGAAYLLLLIAEAGGTCITTDDETVQRAQLAQFGDFVRSVAAVDRPSLVAGDFNINGRRPTSDLYRTLLDEMGIHASGHVTAPPGVVPSDIISPWPEALEWDIDHGDLPRESGRDITQIGTFVGGDAINPAECRAGDYGRSRLDFVLIRPPSRADALAPPIPRFVLARPDGVDREGIWRTLFPALSGAAQRTCAAPPIRLTDHKAVIVSLDLVPLTELARFHAEWPHDVTFEVASIDFTGTSDCVFDHCGPVDPYAELSLNGERFDGMTTRLARTTTQCEGWVLSRAADACMTNWGFLHYPYDIHHDPTVDASHAFYPRFLDADSGGDDELDSLPVGNPLWKIDWPLALLSVRDVMGSVPSGWRDTPILVNGPYDWCTQSPRRRASRRACLRSAITERRIEPGAPATTVGP